MRIEERQINETAREYALRMLKANIIAMELEPGAMVSENELASQLGLSRTPVREALMDLAKFQIVEVLPQRGSRIALIDYALVDEARFARGVLEVAILDQVCDWATPQDCARLRRNVWEQSFVLEPDRESALSLMELDNAFHRMLFRIARKENICRILGDMTLHFDRVRALALSVVRDRRVVEDHRAICAAICGRDAERAKEIMRVHLSRAQVDEEAVRRACPQYIKPRS